MMRKILFFTVLLCAALPAYAQTPDEYCMSSELLTKIREEAQSKDVQTQHAYMNLFGLMLSKAKKDPRTAGCVTPQELAQVCKSVWGDDKEKCEVFVYDITEQIAKSKLTKLAFTDTMRKTEFDDIDPDVFKKAFDAALARRRYKSIPSKLQNMSNVFLEEAEKNNVNPFLTAAISMWESDRGTAGHARTKNNVAGLGGPGKWMKFTSVPDCIAYQSKTLNGYVNEGLTNLTKIGGKYCEKCSEWPGKTASIGRELYRNYNRFLEQSTK